MFLHWATGRLLIITSSDCFTGTIRSRSVRCQGLIFSTLDMALRSVDFCGDWIVGLCSLEMHHTFTKPLSN